MRLAESIHEVTDAVNQARTGDGEYCSNFFPSTRRLQGWITHSELFCDSRGDVTFFWRKDRGFWHLYFCAANPAALQRAMAALPMLRTEPVVLRSHREVSQRPPLWWICLKPPGSVSTTACSAWREQLPRAGTRVERCSRSRGWSLLTRQIASPSSTCCSGRLTVVPNKSRCFMRSEVAVEAGQYSGGALR